MLIEIASSGRQIFMDVDLPEIEDMPSNTATLPSRGWKVSMKTLTDTKKRQLYMTHVHGIGFRLIGETFSTLPTMNQVTAPSIAQGILGGLKQVVGGNIESYVSVCEKARQEAFDRMVKHAEDMSADAVIAFSMMPLSLHKV